MTHQATNGWPDPPAPPFLGTRVEEAELDTALRWLNRSALFRGRWGYPARPAAGGSAPVTGARPAEAVLADLTERCRREDLVTPRLAYGYFRCAAHENDLVVQAGEGEERFHFRRERSEPRRCIADWFRPSARGGDVAALQLVTVGDGVPRALERANREGRYLEMLHLHGLASALAEALAEWLHHRVRAELGIAAGESGDPADAFRHRYQGRRYSFGYPACPDLAEQRTLFRLLRPERIGVTLNASCQMVPEHSTSALVLHHPDAVHFSV